MFSKTLIAALLASTAVATPIASCTGERTYQLRTFGTGAGSIFQGKAIIECDGYLCVNVTMYTADCPTKFTFDKGYVNLPEEQQLYIEDYGVKYAPSADANSTANGWTFIAPGSSKDTTLGSLTFEGYDFHTCMGPDPQIYTITAFPAGQEATGKCYEQIQLIGQEVTASEDS
ncbi:hypothetical protein CJF31_00010326 [Rutstroemia sp. NJR-2017a BVV2]|nr:hypothetical protein CJF31_00010326 [Rutstroemia sp. NJR-2017a BVV2]